MTDVAQGRELDMTRVGDVRTVTIDGVTWNIRVTLRPDSVTLHDAETGALYCEQSPEDLELVYRSGRWKKSAIFREYLLDAFVVAWIMMREKH